MTKAEAMQVAAELTQAVLGGTLGNIVPTSDGKVPDGVRAEDLLAWNVFTIFYTAATQADADETVFKTPASAHPAAAPQASLDGLLSGLASTASPGLAALVKALSPAALTALRALVGAIPTTSIPVPGVPAAPAPAP